MKGSSMCRDGWMVYGWVDGERGSSGDGQMEVHVRMDGGPCDGWIM